MDSPGLNFFEGRLILTFRHNFNLEASEENQMLATMAAQR